MGLVVPAVQVSDSFQIISRLVGQLGTVRLVSAFKSVSSQGFFRPICRPLCQKGHFFVPPVLSCHVFRIRCAPLRVFCGPVVEYRTRNREVAGSTNPVHCTGNLEQVANLLCALANSASYPQSDGK